MPKIGVLQTVKLKDFVKEFGSDIFSSNDTVFRCELCDTTKVLIRR